jgi:SHS2 domain-containing protein
MNPIYVPMPSRHPRWKHYQHLAKIDIRGFGPIRTEALAAVATALTAVVTSPARVERHDTIELECQRPRGIAVYDFLNTLVYEIAGPHMLFAVVGVQVVDNPSLRPARGEAVDKQKHQPDVEIRGRS